jgi:rod shape-determining protein MreC
MQKINRIYNFDVISFAIFMFICILILLSNFTFPNFNYYLANSIKKPSQSVKYYFTQGVFIQYKNFIADKEIIKELQQENSILQEQLALSSIHSFNNLSLQKDIEELSKLINLNSRQNIKIIGTFPIVLTSTSFVSHTFQVKLDNENRNNIAINKLAVSKNMAIGYVSKIYNNSAEILTILDENFKISAFSEQSNINLIVIGNGTYYADVTLYSENQELKEGEIIYTSGLEGNFPRYIPLGRLIKKNNTWKVRLNNNMFDAKYILILQ